jgi:hypothetical protein
VNKSPVFPGFFVFRGFDGHLTSDFLHPNYVLLEFELSLGDLQLHIDHEYGQGDEHPFLFQRSEAYEEDVSKDEKLVLPGVTFRIEPIAYHYA